MYDLNMYNEIHTSCLMVNKSNIFKCQKDYFHFVVILCKIGLLIFIKQSFVICVKNNRMFVNDYTYLIYYLSLTHINKY